MDLFLAFVLVLGTPYIHTYSVYIRHLEIMDLYAQNLKGKLQQTNEKKIHVTCITEHENKAHFNEEST